MWGLLDHIGEIVSLRLDGGLLSGLSGQNKNKKKRKIHSGSSI